MPVITLLQTPPDEPIKGQILQMVVDYLTDISSVALPPSNPLYSLYQYGIGYEVHLYLEALSGARGIPVELLVATDEQDPSLLLGFVLYLPVQDDPQACAVAYMAVLAGHRRQGIARALLGQVRERYPHVELACAVGKVAYFEAMGFQVLGARGPQVLMNTRDHATEGLLAVLDVAPIYRTLEVQQIHAYLLKQHGKRAMVDAEKQRDRHLDQLTRQARAFVQQRLGDTGAQAAASLRLV
ncbi:MULTISPECIES: GNAT family N-acetyltransferase [Pseudomonas]|uniref:Acetyltransferase (GNAT) family protein n=1 Tax=Pseudomonas putida TaxID=303 RepID=A0A9X8HMH6_PSEPU|nr:MULTISPECIES: GNAT family N-acetyltransferase [Pseudomonas]MBG8559461.1 GNAT family N-acetyltransferase [Pseudomonas qingdaonensis]MCQ0169964.1 GNAT family N-acetyltransferase [Pseudomonas sp. S12(2018)]ROQ53390.1 acetyltransferase (GNAT) family protein [Pseudomonas putida]WKL64649.1 GNAT family N-acetyltransferase [Pseudomonas qingdaonensis]